METLTILLIGVAAALGLVSLALGSFVCKAHTDAKRASGTGVSAKKDVAQAGCSDGVTPCNGEHNPDGLHPQKRAPASPAGA